MLRIAMLTSGGDCQALNVAMRGVAKTLYKNVKDVEIYGFMDGYRGMMYKKYRLLKEKDFSGILTQGGTILGTSRTPFKTINVPDADGNDKVEMMIDTYKELKLDCLVVLGGNGSHKTANLLYERGLNVITLPKTIDNDLYGTDMSFGFQSAINIAANTIDCIHTTAASHSRVFIVELMGHKTGWLTLYAGIAGGADIILIPEIPYNIDSVVSAVKSRTESGKRFTIIAVAEGAITKDEAMLTKKEFKKLKEVERQMYPSAAYKLGAMITEATGQEVRVTVPGHVQRGGQPSAYDRVLATRLGVKGAELIMEEKYGLMPCVRNNRIETIPLSEVAGKTRMVETDADIIMQARQLGLCLGD